jgi:tetratricopeptide (TPR) repeat protein
VETSEILEVQKLTDQTSELLSLVVRMADIFVQKLQLDPPSARPEMATIPVQATIEFSRAVDFEDRGEREKAIEHYRKALEIHPDHREARRALERLTGGEGGER